MGKTALSLALTALLTLTNCNNPQKNYEPPVRRTLIEKVQEDVTGFGTIERNNDLGWVCPFTFKTSEDFYIGLFENTYYIADKNGKLLNSGDSRIDKSEIKENESLPEVRDEYHLRRLFIEKQGGIYAKKPSDNY